MLGDCQHVSVLSVKPPTPTRRNAADLIVGTIATAALTLVIKVTGAVDAVHEGHHPFID